MDENRLEGAAREIGGKAEEGVGRLAGNARLQAEGAISQAAGRAQNLYGQTADTARQTATTLDSWFRNAVERAALRGRDGRFSCWLAARPAASPAVAAGTVSCQAVRLCLAALQNPAPASRRNCKPYPRRSAASFTFPTRSR